MISTLNIVIAQLNMVVGDIDGNVSKILEATYHARDKLDANMIVFPELTLSGYPPEDLLLRPSLGVRLKKALQQVSVVQGIDLVIGAPLSSPQGLENQALVVRDGNIIARYAKQCLPNYQVFDEKRYFVSGIETIIYMCEGVKIALLVCEDLWYKEQVRRVKEAGADVIVSINASPFCIGIQNERHQIVGNHCVEYNIPILYVNLVGGQDELVFDGGSFAMNSNGKLAACAGYYTEALCKVVFDIESFSFLPSATLERYDDSSRIYDALVLGMRDYVRKNYFKNVVLGLSGGIDSSLTLAIAVDALGNDMVHAVMMPYIYTSEFSKEVANEQAKMLDVQYSIYNIEPMIDVVTDTLKAELTGLDCDTAKQNLQARCRGMILMAISNINGSLVLTTGNKSEMAVGYTTLYGDMAGGFDVLKDVPKTLVYKLSEYRNTRSLVIPQSVINRPPSAELAPGQVDEDSLPPYNELDKILELYIEQDQSAEKIIQYGFDRKIVYRIVKLVDLNEYKRRQAPVGVRITPRGFGRDRRYPITNGWNPGI